MVGVRAKMKQSLYESQSGISLIEVIATIGIAAVMIMIVGAVSALVAMDRGTKYRSWASSLVQEELETAIDQPFASLTDRTNAGFAWVPYNYGSWQVLSSASAVSGAKVYELKNGAALANSISGLALAPFSQTTAMTYEASVRAVSDSPVGWKAGIAFGVIDHNNYYRLRISSTNLLLEQVASGTATTLYTLSQAFSANTWYALKVIATSASIQVWLDGLLKNTYNGTIHGGEIGLIGLNGAHAYFDDAIITTSGATSWNFDSDAAGSPPASWNRFGLYDFSGAVGKLTIANYGGDPNIKQITARIEWPEFKGTRNVTLATLKSKY